jgi:hypothetical protein
MPVQIRAATLAASAEASLVAANQPRHRALTLAEAVTPVEAAMQPQVVAAARPTEAVAVAETMAARITKPSQNRKAGINRSQPLFLDSFRRHMKPSSRPERSAVERPPHWFSSLEPRSFSICTFLARQPPHHRPNLAHGIAMRQRPSLPLHCRQFPI